MLDPHCDGLLKKSEGTAGSQDIDTGDAESNEEIMEEEPKRMPAPELGEGWTVTLTSRKSGATKGRQDKTWHSPCGQDFRSIVQVKNSKPNSRANVGKPQQKRKSRGASPSQLLTPPATLSQSLPPKIPRILPKTRWNWFLSPLLSLRVSSPWKNQ